MLKTLTCNWLESNHCFGNRGRKSPDQRSSHADTGNSMTKNYNYLIFVAKIEGRHMLICCSPDRIFDDKCLFWSHSKPFSVALHFHLIVSYDCYLVSYLHLVSSTRSSHSPYHSHYFDMCLAVYRVYSSSSQQINWLPVCPILGTFHHRLCNRNLIFGIVPERFLHSLW